MFVIWRYIKAGFVFLYNQHILASHNSCSLSFPFQLSSLYFESINQVCNHEVRSPPCFLASAHHHLRTSAPRPQARNYCRKARGHHRARCSIVSVRATFSTKQLHAKVMRRNPLPNETDGVLVDGSIVNSNANVDTLNNSCWTEPNKRQHEMSDPEYDPFTCQICVIQSGVGPNAWYEAWVRDADNAAVGNLPPINLGPGTRVGKMWTFSAAADSLTMGITSNESPSSASAVTMMWGYQETPQMYFDAATRMGGTNCTFQNDGQDGTMTYFQCHFRCGIPRLIGNA